MRNYRVLSFVVAGLVVLSTEAPAICQHLGGERKSRREPAIHLTATSPLWLKYLAAGDVAKKNGDAEAAKKYIVGALTALDSKPEAFKPFYFGLLEKRVVGLYPQDWSDSKLDEKAQVKLQEEQVALYEKLVRLSAKVPSYNSLVQTVAQSRYKKAADDLAKTKADKSKDAPHDS